MSKFLKLSGLLAAAALAGYTTAALAADGGKYGLGRLALPEEIAAWDTDVRPDGQGLPEGEGSVAEGEKIFAERCASCHGDFGEGRDRWPVLAGGEGTLKSANPVKTVGSYWPFASTVFDYVHRAMPFGDARSLTNDETYSVVAYVLYLNYILEDDAVLNRDNFAEIHMPNEDGFFLDDRPDVPTLAEAEPCMTGCKEQVKVTMRARVLDVTPEGEQGADLEQPATEEAPQTASLDEALAKQGEGLFKRCAACHSVAAGEQKIGPSLYGVFGREAGGLEDFTKYSPAMKELGAAWDAESLDAFLADPRGYVKGTRMSFAGLKKEDQRAAVIEYLKSLSQ
jgi:cytochrome c